MNTLALALVLQASLGWALDTPIDDVQALQCDLGPSVETDPLYQLRIHQGTPRLGGLLWRPETLRLTPKSEAPSSDDLLDTAREFLGTPYVWGGVGRRGLDCSGFVNAVYAKHGYDLPRVSRDQFAWA